MVHHNKVLVDTNEFTLDIAAENLVSKIWKMFFSSKQKFSYFWTNQKSDYQLTLSRLDTYHW